MPEFLSSIEAVKNFVGFIFIISVGDVGDRWSTNVRSVEPGPGKTSSACWKSYTMHVTEINHACIVRDRHICNSMKHCYNNQYFKLSVYMYSCTYILLTILKDLRLILELHLYNMLFVHEVFIKLTTINVTIDTIKRF